MRVSKAFNTSQAMAALLMRMSPGSAVSANTIHVGLFSGTPPTDDQLMAMFSNSASTVSWSAAAISPFATAANFLGDIMVGAVTPAIDNDNNVFQLPLSSQANLATIATSGTPTWFILRFAQTASAADTFVGFTTGSNAYAIITGTVGDENSAADMKIVGGTVTAGQSVRIADMRIKF